jgi:hypothetical protein
MIKIHFSNLEKFLNLYLLSEKLVTLMQNLPEI